MASLTTRLVGGFARLLSPGGSRASLLILTYHRVMATVDPMFPDEPDQERFAAQMRFMRGAFNLIDLAEATERLQGGTLPTRAACITFDDGYANNLTVAAPVLVQYSIPATVFVTTGVLGGGRMWNDTVIEAVRNAGASLNLDHLGLGSYRLQSWESRRNAVNSLLDKLKYLPLEERVAKAGRLAEAAREPLPNSLMMTEDQVRQLVKMGIKIGAHTVQHPILASIGRDSARAEIRNSKRLLEEITGRSVHMFAYPNGRPGRDYCPEHVAMVRESGFSGAVTTAWGAARAATDPYQLPRIAPWRRRKSRDAARLLKTYIDPPPDSV